MPPRLIAFYLPQYHPIPENDAWWGKGFTEWTNVAKAKPLFKGHYQPHLPADLGFYDLRVPEVRQAQADMAREYGIYGFCYWHYWFAGKQLLERPFHEVLASGKPDFPFCLAWANQSWTGIWHGAPDRVLIEQTYPGEQDHIDHFNTLLPAFRDERYINVDDKPLFLIYMPHELPNSAETVKLWRHLAEKAGLPGIFFVGCLHSVCSDDPVFEAGFDGFTITKLHWPNFESKHRIWKIILSKLKMRRINKFYRKVLKRPFNVYDFKTIAESAVYLEKLPFEYYPSILPNWDNTPRSGYAGYIGTNSTPDLFGYQIERAINRVSSYPDERKMIFIKSWNEWAEGNYLEPDQRYGKAYLEALRSKVLEDQ